MPYIPDSDSAANESICYHFSSPSHSLRIPVHNDKIWKLLNLLWPSGQTLQLFAEETPVWVVVALDMWLEPSGDVA